MQHAVRRSAGLAKWPDLSPSRCVVVGATSVMVASAALGGCAVSDDMMATTGPTSETAPAEAGTQPTLMTPPGQPQAMTVTPKQRGYLDALTAEGMRPSDNLLALSIGSYVCQARAAKQSDQEVWAFVVPLVRSDVRKGSGEDGGTTLAPSVADVDEATTDYIRIATERLC